MMAHLVADERQLVGDRRDAAERHAERAELAREERRVRVDDLSRKNLVADDDNARRQITHSRPSLPSSDRDRTLAEFADAEAHVDERRLAAAERALEGRADLRRLLDVLAVRTDRFGD